MRVRCPYCNEKFELPPESKGKATTLCLRCGRIMFVDDAMAPAATSREQHDDPGTVPALEPLDPGEDPTQIGVAALTLSLPPGKRVSVVVLSGPRRGEVVPLSRARLTFGTEGEGADVQVPDPEVSRSHAALECHGPRIVLRDLGSRNGTFVGDERVSQREMEGGREFRLGATTFLLLVSDV